MLCQLYRVIEGGVRGGVILGSEKWAGIWIPYRVRCIDGVLNVPIDYICCVNCAGMRVELEGLRVGVK